MHILAFSPRYIPAIGGAESYLIALAERFVADGHTVTVITTDSHDFQLFWDPTVRRVESAVPTNYNGVDVIRFPVRYLPFAPLSYHAWRRGLWLLSHLPLPLAGIMGRLARYTPYLPELSMWVKTADVTADIVIGLNICYEPILEAGSRLAKRLDIPFVVCPFTHLGAGAEPGRDSQSRFYTMQHQISAVKKADALLMQTATERDFYIAQNLPAEKTHLASVGITPSSYGQGDGGRWREQQGIATDTPIIAYIGTHDYDKGTTHLIEAVRSLWAQGVDCELVLAGSQTAQFSAYIAQLDGDVRQRIRLLGRVTEEEKQDILDALDLFAMPSRIDSFGIVYLEAWLYGKPVVGSHAWGMADVIADGEDGLLVRFGDALALSRALQTLLVDPDKRQEMGERGRAKTLQQHTWAQKYETVLAIFTDLIS